MKALIAEMKLQKDFFQGEKIETIYFGGGSPSLLEADEIKILTEHIHNNFYVDNLLEVTLEANPDDLTTQKIKALKTTAINRFSIGVQSFFDEDLIWMNRVHNSSQADSAIKTAQDAGFENITIDLIYGTPTLTDLNWKKNLAKAIDLKVPHISAYGLTVEEKTPLHKLIAKHQKENVDEIKLESQMMQLMETLMNKGFEHYEISNFAKPNHHAIHNTNYWKGKKYLGLGASAHSYNGNERSWNVSNNNQYIEAILKGELIAEKEVLTTQEKFNEWLMTGLRTQWGCDLQEGEQKFELNWIKQLLQEATPYIEQKKIKFDNKKLTLTNKGKLIADKIISDLMMVK